MCPIVPVVKDKSAQKKMHVVLPFLNKRFSIKFSQVHEKKKMGFSFQGVQVLSAELHAKRVDGSLSGED